MHSNWTQSNAESPGRSVLAMLSVLGLAAAGLFAAAAAQAQEDYPTEPVNMIIGFSPGGGSDTTGRIISQALSERLGQPVVAENRPGAGSTIAADYVANSEPNGQTLMYVSSDGISLGAALRDDLPYDPLEDFELISRMVGFPYIIAANPDVPFDTLEGMIEHANENPNGLRYGSSGVGSGPQMATEYLAHLADIELEHVAYPGAAPAATATVAGEIELVIAAPSTVQTHSDSGDLKVLGVTGLERHANFPDAPTLAEAGLEETEITIWWGVVAPAGTPENVLNTLEEALADVAQDDGVRDQLTQLGYDVIYLGSEEFREFAEEDIERWTDTAETANITLEQ